MKGWPHKLATVIWTERKQDGSTFTKSIPLGYCVCHGIPVCEKPVASRLSRAHGIVTGCTFARGHDGDCANAYLRGER